MIKASLYIKVIGTTFREMPVKLDEEGNPIKTDKEYICNAAAYIYTSKDKESAIGSNEFIFEGLTLSQLTLPSVYGLIMAQMENPTIA